MSVFIGEYSHSIDDKGRVSMPSKFREDLGSVFYITKGMDSCLFVYDQEEWSRAEQKINELRLTRKDARAFSRLFFAGASSQSLDKQGRVVIPQNLREYAGLSKDVVIIGVSNRIEIWDRNKWDDYNASDDFSYDALADHMDDLDF